MSIFEPHGEREGGNMVIRQLFEQSFRHLFALKVKQPEPFSLALSRHLYIQHFYNMHLAQDLDQKQKRKICYTIAVEKWLANAVSICVERHP